MEPEEPVQSIYLNKKELEQVFQKLFEIQANSLCFQCGKNSKQWVQKNHAIFLCLNCAALYKQISWATSIRSTVLDLWTQQEINFLKKGGNQRFKDFLQKYELYTVSYKEKIRTKAANYYRIMLQEEAKGHDIPLQPSPELAKQQFRPNVSIVDMSPQEILEGAKEKAIWVGAKTKQYGGKAIDKIHHKVTSGELKKDAKDVAQKVSNNAKLLWGKLAGKISDIKSKYYDEKAEEKQQPLPK